MQSVVHSLAHRFGRQLNLTRTADVAAALDELTSDSSLARDGNKKPQMRAGRRGRAARRRWTGRRCWSACTSGGRRPRASACACWIASAVCAWSAAVRALRNFSRHRTRQTRCLVREDRWSNTAHSTYTVEVHACRGRMSLTQACSRQCMLPGGSMLDKHGECSHLLSMSDFLLRSSRQVRRPASSRSSWRWRAASRTAGWRARRARTAWSASRPSTPRTCA